MKRSERGISKEQCERANNEEGGILKQSDVLNHTLGKVLKLIMN